MVEINKYKLVGENTKSLKYQSKNVKYSNSFQYFLKEKSKNYLINKMENKFKHLKVLLDIRLFCLL